MLKYLIYEHTSNHPSNISKVTLSLYIYFGGFMGGGGVVGWRVYGVVVCVVVWVMVGWVVGWFIGWVHIHPLMNSYNVKIFNFMNSRTHPLNISKVSLCHFAYTLEGSLGGWVGV